ncbi:hypothetical protein L207DRAFT_446321 [Hyaloscypha variabilis F]|uniref:Uncharacterized protein n=1 Tax=Hyaloscypha variabilis (strain UAMH 11265 / GT02V1 / F) TaxID=1149755 RepID=A0A2J6QRM2_HYAVF|nr:hypothetical protein L207DRAFT_446321 [Hyaloscypha variabilis F]
MLTSFGRHFETVHRPPQCERCYRLFPDSKKLNDNRREPEGCLIGEVDLKEGIDDPQWDEIEVLLSAQGRRRINNVSRWYAIWNIFFQAWKHLQTHVSMRI